MTGPEDDHQPVAGQSVGASLLTRGSLVGFAGAVLVAIGACSTGFSLQGAWGSVLIQAIGSQVARPVANALIIAGVALLCFGWWLLRPGGRGRPRLLPILALWTLPLLVVPPVMSADPFLYADLGYILGQGRDPYLVRLTGLGGPYAPWVDEFWAGHGVAYPPLSLELARVLVDLSGLHPYWGVVAQRLSAVVGVGLLALLLPRVAGRLGVDRRWALWLGALNPIVIVHLIGGAHNDAIMAGAVMVALWLCLQPIPFSSLVLAPIVVGLAMGLKPQAGLAAVAVAGLPVVATLRHRLPAERLWLLGWRTVVASAVAVATFAATSWATGLGFGWVRWLSEMGRARTITPAILIGDAFWWTGRTVFEIASALIALLAVAAFGWLLVSHADDPMGVVAWGSVLLLFVSQALHPWYLGLSLALLALCPLPERVARRVVWITVGYLIAYTIQFLMFWLPWMALPFGVLAGWWLRRHHRLAASNEPIRLG